MASLSVALPGLKDPKKQTFSLLSYSHRGLFQEEKLQKKIVLLSFPGVFLARHAVFPSAVHITRDGFFTEMT